MTRLEEIRQASIRYSPDIAARRLGFIEGAMWSDRTIIDTACNWLVENAKNYMMNGEEGYWYDSIKLKHALKKAMKE